MGFRYSEKIQEKAFEVYLTGKSAQYIADNAIELFGDLLPKNQKVSYDAIHQWVYKGKWKDKRKALTQQIKLHEEMNGNPTKPLNIVNPEGSHTLPNEGKILAKEYRTKMELVKEQAEVMSMLVQKFKRDIGSITIRPAEYIASIEEHQKLVTQLQQARETQAILDPRVENNPKVLEAKKKLEQAIYEAEKEAGIV